MCETTIFQGLTFPFSVRNGVGADKINGVPNSGHVKISASMKITNCIKTEMCCCYWLTGHHMTICRDLVLRCRTHTNMWLSLLVIQHSVHTTQYIARHMSHDIHRACLLAAVDLDLASRWSPSCKPSSASPRSILSPRSSNISVIHTSCLSLYRNSCHSVSVTEGRPGQRS